MAQTLRGELADRLRLESAGTRSHARSRVVSARSPACISLIRTAVIALQLDGICRSTVQTKSRPSLYYHSSELARPINGLIPKAAVIIRWTQVDTGQSVVFHCREFNRNSSLCLYVLLKAKRTAEERKHW